MHRRGRSSAGRWALGALLVVALVGGVAWAETQIAALPNSPHVKVVAVLVPGPGGGEVCGDHKGDDAIKFSIGGNVEAGGEVCGPYDPHGTYQVTLDYHETASGWMVEIVVENLDTQELVYLGSEAIAAPPASVFATGELVLSLTASL